MGFNETLKVIIELTFSTQFLGSTQVKMAATGNWPSPTQIIFELKLGEVVTEKHPHILYLVIIAEFFSKSLSHYKLKQIRLRKTSAVL